MQLMTVIEEQIAVRFTGKVNVLASLNRQYLGHLLFKDGDIIQVIFQNSKGLKAFYQLLIQEFSLQAFSHVVEPEIVDENERQIHYPFAVLRNKISEVLKNYRESMKFRPPENVKIELDNDFMKDGVPVDSHEFEVLCTLADHSKTFDVYQHCPLLDHEITWALVSLRKKGALKIVASKNNL